MLVYICVSEKEEFLLWHYDVCEKHFLVFLLLKEVTILTYKFLSKKIGNL